ncbi:MAG: hypothetical protein HY788_00680 [Deltaproteobacteria bacterium]|nr:hypothetical protein [Deltaproteobacteria bacterium]
MSQHLVDRKEPPPGISSFTKIRLGWISPEQAVLVQPGDTRYAFLSPLAKKGGTLVVKIPLPQGRYYLVENRQTLGFDRMLPDSGILVLKVDPEVREGSGTVRVMNADPRFADFSHATFRPDKENRSLFLDSGSNVAVIPLWAEGGNHGVLVTTPDKSRSAVQAAMAIQRLLKRFPEPRNEKQDMAVREAVASFKRLDFNASSQKARELPD